MKSMNNTKSEKKSFFISYILFRLKSEKTAVIFSAILAVLGAPLAAVTFAASMWGFAPNGQYHSSIPEILLLLSVGAVIMTFFTAAVLPAVLTRYYRNKSAADMYYSMPLSNNARFFGDFSVGLILTVVPFAVLGGAAVMLVNQNAAVLAAKYHDCEYVLRGAAQCQQYSAPVFVSILLCLLAAYALGCMISACCGRLAHSLIFTFVTMAVLPAAVIIIMLFALMPCGGIYTAPEIAKAAGTVPPLGIILYPIINIFFNGYLSYYAVYDTFSVNSILAVTNPLSVVINLLFIAAFIAAAYFLSKHRRAEYAEKPFAYNIIYHVLTLFLVFCLIGAGLLLSAGGGALVVMLSVTAAVVIALAVYITFERLHYKSFKKIGFSLLRFFCAAGVTVAAYALLGASHGLGAERYVPDPEQVEYVCVDGDMFDIPTEGRSIYGRAGFLKLTGEEDIRRVCELHEKTLDGGCGTNSTVVLRYRLKSGKTVERFYEPEHEVTAEWYGFVTGTPEYAEAVFTPFENREGYKVEDMTCRFFLEGDDFIDSEIETGRINDFIAIFKSDWIKHGADPGRRVGGVSGYIGAYDRTNGENAISHGFSMYIGENMTDTISFLQNPDYSKKATSYKPQDGVVLDIQYSKDGGWESFMVIEITRAQLENKDVRELMSLARLGEYRTLGGVSDKVGVSATMSECARSYFFAKEDEERVAEIVNRIWEQPAD